MLEKKKTAARPAKTTKVTKKPVKKTLSKITAESIRNELIANYMPSLRPIITFDWSRLAAVYKTMPDNADPYQNLTFCLTHFFYWENRYLQLCSLVENKKLLPGSNKLLDEAHHYATQWRDHVYGLADEIKKNHPEASKGDNDFVIPFPHDRKKR